MRGRAERKFFRFPVKTVDIAFEIWYNLCIIIDENGRYYMYEPKPIDTNDIELDRDIMELCELIAKNTHEVWSQGRIKEGWRYGEKRDDARKLHPCLIPYEELPESEKEYDRNTSLETLKLIIKLGYDIKKS